MGTTTGVDESATAGMAGTERTVGRLDDREAALDNQLNELRGQQAEIARFDPADPRVGEIEEVIKELQVDRKATAMNAPGVDEQKVVDFNKFKASQVDAVARSAPEIKEALDNQLSSLQNDCDTDQSFC
jgi:hypothetical protein